MSPGGSSGLFFIIPRRLQVRMKPRAEQHNNGDEDDDCSKSYTCGFCKRGFSNAQALGGHMNIHRKDRAKLKEAADNHYHFQTLLSLHISNSNSNSNSNSCTSSPPPPPPPPQPPTPPPKSTLLVDHPPVSGEVQLLDLELRLGPVPTPEASPSPSSDPTATRFI